MNRSEEEVKTMQKIHKAAESYFNEKITKEAFDRKIDSAIYDALTELDMVPLREVFYHYKTFASKSWLDYDVVGM